MNVEIVYAGLCAFHNVRDVNPTMPEPSVILVRTDAIQEESLADEALLDSVRLVSRRVEDALAERRSMTQETYAAAKLAPLRESREARAERPERDDAHIPLIAFNGAEVQVSDSSGFVDIEFAPNCKMLPLNGVEIVIQNDDLSPKPAVDDTYDLIVKKDDYWPEAQNQWNRDFVPVRGQKPKKSAVAAWMRFGTGTISGGRLSPVPWKFAARPQSNVPQRVGHYAIEAFYSQFQHSGDAVVLELRDLETGALIRDPLRFSPKSRNLDTLRLFIGNMDRLDIDDFVLRTDIVGMANGDDFRFLNRVSSAQDPGIFPEVVDNRPRRPVEEIPPGGVTSGPCGPTSSNG